MSEIERAKEYPALKEKRMTRNDIIQGNINMLDSGASECRKIGKLASAEEKEIIAEILRAELEREKNQLTCDGCKREEIYKELDGEDKILITCLKCARSKKTDRYEKEELTCTQD